MNVLSTRSVLFRALGWNWPRTKPTQQVYGAQLSDVSRWGPAGGSADRPGWRCCSFWSPFEAARFCQVRPWVHQQVRTVKRGTEYQPKNIKRKRTHGWLKRISTRGGIEVILRRMLKRRKSLTH